MGNLCSNSNSVGVINSQIVHPEPSTHRSVQIKNAEHHGSRGSRQTQITDWQTLIATLRAKKSLEQYALSKKRTEFR